MRHYSDKKGKASVNRLTHIHEAFSKLLSGLTESSDASDFKRAMGKIDEASDRLGELQKALNDARAADLAKVSAAIDVLVRLSNHIELPKPDSKPPEGKSADEWNNELMRRYRFALMREAEQEGFVVAPASTSERLKLFYTRMFT